MRVFLKLEGREKDNVEIQRGREKEIIYECPLVKDMFYLFTVVKKSALYLAIIH